MRLITLIPVYSEFTTVREAINKVLNFNFNLHKFNEF